MDQSFEVYEYSITLLERLIAEKSRKNSPAVIAKKLHRFYFEGYFKEIKARTIVVENNYVDHDYLEDFAAYYVRCFHPYERRCARLHFFEISFKQNEFTEILKGHADESICKKVQDAYLGFVVVKPLPKTVVGRTCLRTYPTENRRHYPITRSYSANLFGLDLAVETLAFQEQDKAVAACATSALWSVLQGTGKLFQHHILSPVEITKAATDQIPTESRSLPNSGLSPAMMARAIRSVSLEPFLVSVEDEYILKSTLYAYLQGKIPMILGIELIDISKTQGHSRGRHAIATTGFSLGRNKPEPYGPSNFMLRASRIDKIYVHDDQVGPFARMEFDNVKLKVLKKERSSLTTSWRGDDGVHGSVRAMPEILMVPLYHKIRIPFEVVHDAVLSFDELITVLADELDEKPDALHGKKLEWDIYLTTVNDLKKQLLSEKSCGYSPLEDVLLENMPRFMWRATALSDKNAKLLDLLFDATDIELGPFFIRAIEYDEGVSSFVRAASRSEPLRAYYSASTEGQILEWFSQRDPKETKTTG